MNNLFQENKNSFLFLLGLFFILSIVLFFTFVRPLGKELKKQELAVSSLETEVSVLEVKATKLSEMTIDTSSLEKQLPLTIDPTGVYFRHEGQSVISGYSEKVKPGISFTWRRSFFEETLWPVLAHRVENFAYAKISSGWAGIYSHNTIDQNAIIGEHPQLSGYYLACGFSGHGMQQAPAVGKGLAELIMLGKFETIDLYPLRFERFAEEDLVIEGAIV